MTEAQAEQVITPLTAILGMAERIQSDLEATSQQLAELISD